jgi:Na+/proline symporter
LSYPHWIAAQLVALAYLFSSIMGIPFDYGIALGASIVVFYTYIGGMWAVSYTDMLQSIMIVVGLVILLYEILNQTHGIAPIFANQPDSFFRLTPDGGIKEWSEYTALFLAFVAGSIPVQEIYQRVFSAKDERAAKNGLYLGAILLVLVPSIPLIIALGGVYLHPELLDNPNKEELMPTLVNLFTNLPVQILFYGAMISAILSTSSGAMLAPATVVGENLIKPYIPHISDRKLLLFTRLSVIGVAAVSCYFAFDDSDIIGLVETSVSLILVCVFAPFTFGLFWKKASVFGAWAAMIGGGVTMFSCMALDTVIDGSIYGIVVSCATMVLASLIKPDSPQTAVI